MTGRRPPLAFLLVLAVVAGVVVLLGALAFQAFTGTDREAPPTFVQQLEGLSFIEEVETDSERREVESDDPGAARQALAAVDASALQPWLGAASPDEGEESGFWLQVGGETLTDPASVR